MMDIEKIATLKEYKDMIERYFLVVDEYEHIPEVHTQQKIHYGLCFFGNSNKNRTIDFYEVYSSFEDGEYGFNLYNIVRNFELSKLSPTTRSGPNSNRKYYAKKLLEEINVILSVHNQLKANKND